MDKPYSYGVSAAHSLAVEAGMSVLEAGGNAVDAAIAVSYMLGVVEPYASGIGGGGVMLVVPPEGSDPVICDYREIAPMSGIVSPQQVGVPGFVRGMGELHRRFGTVDMSELLDPAIQAAESGFPAGAALHRQLVNTQHLPAERFPEFFPDGEPLRTGERLQQPLLAETMRMIRDKGARWFYEGEPARRISELVEGMEPGDFQAYQVLFREPVRASYDRFDLVTCPPPFGGLTLIQALKLSERLQVSDRSGDSADYLHLWGEIFSQCYALRKTTMGDPDFCDLSVSGLLDRELLERMAANVRPDVVSAQAAQEDVANTTHFCVADRQGMVVSATNTIGGFFTTGLTEGGYFLNNQLRNFTDSEESPNRPEPGKRPQSFVCPTVLRSPEHTIVIGSAGGKRIPMVLAAILNQIAAKGSSLVEAVAAPRFFIDQNEVYLEAEPPAVLEKRLVQLGYEVKHHPDAMFYGGVHGLMLLHESRTLLGAADPRRGGASRAVEAMPEARSKK